MSANGPLPHGLTEYPEMQPIHEAIRQYRRGEKVTARCLRCNQVLTVRGLKVIGTVWVTCPHGCSNYHENWNPGTITDTLRDILK